MKCRRNPIFTLNYVARPRTTNFRTSFSQVFIRKYSKATESEADIKENNPYLMRDINDEINTLSKYSEALEIAKMLKKNNPEGYKQFFKKLDQVGGGENEFYKGISTMGEMFDKKKPSIFDPIKATYGRADVYHQIQYDLNQAYKQRLHELKLQWKQLQLMHGNNAMTAEVINSMAGYTPFAESETERYRSEMGLTKKEILTKRKAEVDLIRKNWSMIRKFLEKNGCDKKKLRMMDKQYRSPVNLEEYLDDKDVQKLIFSPVIKDGSFFNYDIEEPTEEQQEKLESIALETKEHLRGYIGDIANRVEHQLRVFLTVHASELKMFDEGKRIDNAEVEKIGRHILATFMTDSFNEVKNILLEFGQPNLNIEDGFFVLLENYPSALSDLLSYIGMITTTDARANADDDLTILRALCMTLDGYGKVGLLLHEKPNIESLTVKDGEKLYNLGVIRRDDSILPQDINELDLVTQDFTEIKDIFSNALGEDGEESETPPRFSRKEKKVNQFYQSIASDRYLKMSGVMPSDEQVIKSVKKALKSGNNTKIARKIYDFQLLVEKAINEQESLKRLEAEIKRFAFKQPGDINQLANEAIQTYKQNSREIENIVISPEEIDNEAKNIEKQIKPFFDYYFDFFKSNGEIDMKAFESRLLVGRISELVKTHIGKDIEIERSTVLRAVLDLSKKDPSFAAKLGKDQLRELNSLAEIEDSFYTEEKDSEYFNPIEAFHTIQEVLRMVADDIVEEAATHQVDRKVINYIFGKIRANRDKDSSSLELQKYLREFFETSVLKKVTLPSIRDMPLEKLQLEVEKLMNEKDTVDSPLSEIERELIGNQLIQSKQFSPEYLSSGRKIEDLEPVDLFDNLEDYLNEDNSIISKKASKESTYGNYISSHLPVEQIFNTLNINQYIEFSEHDFQKYLPEGAGGRIEAEEFKFTKTCSLLLRREVIEAIEGLQNSLDHSFASSMSPKSTLFYGHDGCGKSALMSLVVFWARKSDWLVVYIPDGYEWTSKGRYIVKNEKYGTWDQPHLAKRMFECLINAHQDKLSQIQMKNTFSAGKREAKTLFELCELGSLFEQYAPEAFIHFRREISHVTEFPVLFAIDGYNCLFGNSNGYRDPESQSFVKKFLPVERLTMSNAFLNSHIDPKLSYGTFIGALSSGASKYNFHQDMLTRQEKSRNTWIESRPYDKEEFTSVLQHYSHTKAIRTHMSPKSYTEAYVRQLTSGFGRDVSKYCERL